MLTGVDHERRTSSEASSWAAQEVAPCATGGSRKPPDGLLGYVKLHVERNPDLFFDNYDPPVFDQFVEETELEPCGLFGSVIQRGLQEEQGALGEIAVPVIVINGDNDRIFAPGEGEPPSADQHSDAFTGSPDVTPSRSPAPATCSCLGGPRPRFGRSSLAG